jgi:hypothetical protein
MLCHYTRCYYIDCHGAVIHSIQFPGDTKLYFFVAIPLQINCDDYRSVPRVAFLIQFLKVFSISIQPFADAGSQVILKGEVSLYW